MKQNSAKIRKQSNGYNSKEEQRRYNESVMIGKIEEKSKKEENTEVNLGKGY